MRMKVTVEHIEIAEPEIVIRCNQLDDELASVIDHFSGKKQRLQIVKDDTRYFLCPEKVCYVESVDGRVYVYTDDNVYQTRSTLSEITEYYQEEGFFRCAKSMTVNLNSIASLKSCTGGRIVALLSNGERILISRQYSRLLRNKLKGGKL